MRIAFIGQQDFGAAVLEAFLGRGDEIVGVFCAPEKEGAKPDILKRTALERGLPVFQFPSLKSDEAEAAMRGLGADIGIMAYVLQFAPQSFVNIPKHGTIQYHPSLLPAHRGPSAINWPIAKGETRTGLSIFRPTDGLDEGPVILQKACEIGPDDTTGDVYFERLFPLGVAAMLEAADLVVSGRHVETVQDESQASYEGWFRAPEATIHWASHIDQIYDLIRAANPAPGAVTTLNGETLKIYDARKHPVRTIGEVKGKPGEVVAVGADSFHVTAQGGRIEILIVRPESGGKMPAGEFARAKALAPGAALGD
ncbi:MULTISPECIES: methionyl-tRNA formyltransferase [Methylobacterium]|uniref:Methionyl-tRNA formyltransferase n=3 Tax=Pseudomonadota TaxID=1224 RepID=A0ABQ4T0M9_9HYPH|nr:MULTISPECIES: methionyl-tRNA formyltransferase [Methylobacterium]PIU08330.1 MAG: methionyl-tRNA formyltransferase [Methylobacterium sp. CG09_land_8_20_14_0_10_71_15]PIU11614.1 MAG: methionyl-tRNA formyltransferase [Methylobacterium sp. CG08_land_8_20_14_0_20_71_15]GBU20034.1 L-methionyl-tRNA(fMet) N-formyltransferase [Methylobacterium sp.]GJE08308.1 Methionyl-tRNA formyltransferase [Methylobacterium jeotgali]